MSYTPVVQPAMIQPITPVIPSVDTVVPTPAPAPVPATVDASIQTPGLGSKIWSAGKELMLGKPAGQLGEIQTSDNKMLYGEMGSKGFENAKPVGDYSQMTQENAMAARAAQKGLGATEGILEKVFSAEGAKTMFDGGMALDKRRMEKEMYSDYKKRQANQDRIARERRAGRQALGRALA